MNKARLERLITIMEGVRDAQKPFDLSAWIAEGDVRNGEVCGTTCCALGYAALDPVLRQDGLRLAVDYFERCDSYGEGTGYVKIDDIGDIASYNALVKSRVYDLGGKPTFDGASDFGAGAKFFEISEVASYYLFDPATYDTRAWKIKPDHVIERIRELIANDGKAPIELQVVE